MELGQYQMQVFVSLVVILGAAFVALVCDLLKGNNEQLRELALELKVRREEELKRFQILAPQILAEATAGGPAIALREISKSQPETSAGLERKPRRTRDSNKRPLSSDAVAAIQLGEQMAVSPKPRASAPVPAPVEQPQEQPAPAGAKPDISTSSRPMVPPAPVSSGRSRDWGRLLSVRRPAPPAPKRRSVETPEIQEGVGLLDAVVAATASATSGSPEPALPSGFQDGFVLSRLVETRQPVSGLVVSIGVTSKGNGGTANPDQVQGLIQSLLGPNDFAAQSGNDDFLLIYPGERGAQAQRKLAQIAEQLWEFQLGSVGALSVQFSWGGLEVRSESIDEAVASATERMEQTRRGRKILTMEARSVMEAPLRQAV